MALITVTASVEYTYDTDEVDFIQTEADAIADVTEMLANREISADEFEITSVLDEKGYTAP